MALVIYPLDGWNSFVTLLEADTIIATYVNDNGYLALTDPEKEAHLIQSAMLISLCPNIVLPVDTEEQLKNAQCQLTVYNLINDPLAYDPNEKAINKEKVDSLEVGYDVNFKKDPDALTFPPVVMYMLKPYGCKTSGGFTQSFAGRG